MTRRGKLRQLIVVGFRTETPAELKRVATSGVGGFMLLGNNPTGTSIKKNVQPRVAAITGVTPVLGIKPWLTVDEEGGRVQRLAGLGRLPSARVFAAQPPERITETIKGHSLLLRKLGFDVNYAPVLDLDDRIDGVIASRSFSANPEVAWKAAAAYSNGLVSGGIMPVYKHFPGHGTANGDSHKVLPTTKPLSVLKQNELVLFQRAIDQKAPMIMVGHLVVPGLSRDAQTPTSADPATYALLRSMGFTGVAITDALDMNALSGYGSIGERAAAAMIAGADVVLLTAVAQLESTVDELDVAATKGMLTQARIDEAWVRVWCTKSRTVGKA
jgi:beta-N-acetylhexosaminidase